MDQLLEDLATIEGRSAGSTEEQLVVMEIESAELEVPVQLDLLVEENGKVVLGAVPPLYDVATSFDPVFHQLKITLVPVSEEAGFSDTQDNK